MSQCTIFVGDRVSYDYTGWPGPRTVTGAVEAIAEPTQVRGREALVRLDGGFASWVAVDRLILA